MRNKCVDSIQYGKLFYKTGAIRFEGYILHSKNVGSEPNGQGIMYFRNGKVYREGIFQHGGLLVGKEYYQSGNLKFEGRYNNRKVDGSYYGPTYPVCGKFFNDEGELLYEGEFEVIKQGNVGYPKVIFPEGFGSLE